MYNVSDIYNCKELEKKSKETLGKEDAFVFIVKMLTQDSVQQIVLLQKITKLEEQHPININLLQPFDDCLTAFVLSKLLDFIQFERVILFTI